MGQSYLDLTLTQRKRIVKWTFQNSKVSDVINVTELGPFVLDLPLHRARKALTPKVVSVY